MLLIREIENMKTFFFLNWTLSTCETQVPRSMQAIIGSHLAVRKMDLI